MKKTLLFYTDCFIFGGCENVLVNLIQSSEVRNLYDVRLAYASNTDYRKGIEDKLGGFATKYPVRVLGHNNLFYRLDTGGLNRYAGYLVKFPFVILQMFGVYAVYNFVRLYFLFRKFRPDILHINNGGYPGAYSCLMAVFSAKAAGVRRIVFTVNNLAWKQRGIIDRMVDGYLKKQVDCFTTASALARTRLIENRHFLPDRIVQVYNAMGRETVRRGREELLAEFGVTQDKFVLVTVALLTARKGQTYLLKALSDIKDRDTALFDRIVLFLVGDGEDRPRLEQFVREHGLGKNAVITGYRKDYYDFINAADLFILPSLRDEDMPLVILSAMGLGKAVVSTKVSGITEEIRDGVDGKLLDPAGLDNLAPAIEALLNDRARRDQYGKSAKRRYDDCFSLGKIVAEYLRIYGIVLNRKPDFNGNESVTWRTPN